MYESCCSSIIDKNSGRISTYVENILVVELLESQVEHDFNKIRLYVK